MLHYQMKGYKDYVVKQHKHTKKEFNTQNKDTIIITCENGKTSMGNRNKTLKTKKGVEWRGIM